MAMVLAAVLAGCRSTKEAPVSARRKTTVTIAEFTWNVDVSDTVELRYLGLSGRERLADTEGMLFVYKGSAERSYCMREMRFPLDIAFVTEDLEIARIYTMAVEPGGSGDIAYTCYTPVMYVLEVNAGQFAELGINEGDTIAIGQ